MRSVEIIVMKEEREELSTVMAGVIRTSISPFAGEGLDKTFGLAIGLRAIRASEEMTQAQIFASSGEEF